jgi:hypothetical protein
MSDERDEHDGGRNGPDGFAVELSLKDVREVTLWAAAILRKKIPRRSRKPGGGGGETPREKL